jgi:F0F1-type ATP synthase assembly protein I
LTGIADDLTGVIKRNPIPAVLVGIGIGYLIAHALRR